MSGENLFTYTELESSKGKEIANLTGAKYSSSDLQEFALNDSVKIRVLLIGDEPYFIAMDIAKVLDYKDAEAMTRRLDADEIQNLHFVGFGNRGVNLINESGLYNAILGSNKPEAKAFKKWVTKEVLPSIRKNGTDIAERDRFLPQVKESAMGDSVKIFSNETLGSVRTILKEDGDPLFCLGDIAKILEIQNIRQLKPVLDEEFNKGGIFYIHPLETAGGKQNFTFINEPELYFVLMRSRSDKAKPFRQWVVCEVLPSIRKNGGYIAGQEKLSDEELLAKALLVANNVIQNKDKVIAKQQETIADQAEIINAYQVTDKIKRNKQELATLLNRKIRELADLEFGRQYAKCYNEIYKEFAKLHCFTHKVDMQFLRTNIDYLSECLKLVLGRIQNAKEQK